MITTGGTGLNMSFYARDTVLTTGENVIEDIEMGAGFH
jgi:hypothetical protein